MLSQGKSSSLWCNLVDSDSVYSKLLISWCHWGTKTSTIVSKDQLIHLKCKDKGEFGVRKRNNTLEFNTCGVHVVHFDAALLFCPNRLTNPLSRHVARTYDISHNGHSHGHPAHSSHPAGCDQCPVQPEPSQHRVYPVRWPGLSRHRLPRVRVPHSPSGHSGHVRGQAGELLCPARVLAVQESAHDWQVPGKSLSYRRGGGRTSMSSLSGTGGELLCPGVSSWLASTRWVSIEQGGGEGDTMSSLSGTGGRTSMSRPCARHPGVSSCRTRGGDTMSSLSGTGGRTTMSNLCARRPGVSSWLASTRWLYVVQRGIQCPVSVVQDNTSIIASFHCWIMPGQDGIKNGCVL